MSIRMKFSKGGEVTSRQMWYRQPDSASGTYTWEGLAWITKLIHDFCKENTNVSRENITI